MNTAIKLPTTGHEFQSLLIELTDQYGWVWELTSIAETGSRYYELTRVGVDSAYNEYNEYPADDESFQTLNLRYSDHPTAHCSEDISLCPDPSPDDYTLDDLIIILQSKFKPD